MIYSNNKYLKLSYTRYDEKVIKSFIINMIQRLKVIRNTVF